MKAVVWHAKRDVRVENVPDPRIEQPTDAIIRITSSGLCGSDLHLYEVLGPFMQEGDILGHEPMGIVEAVGADVHNIAPGDRVVIPFQIACGHCFMCNQDLQTQCETTSVTEFDKGAALFGYTKMYGAVPGAQAELLRVPHADYGPIKVPHGPSDDRFVYLSDVLPTAWQAVEYANVPKGGSLLVLGLGPIGDMAVRVARAQGVEKVIGVDLVGERLVRAQQNGATTINMADIDNISEAVREMTAGRGADSVIDAVGMEAHGSTAGKVAQNVAGFLPSKLSEALMNKAGVDRMPALYTAIESVRRGGTVSISGVYGGMADPMPLLTMFDKQIEMRMGQANVKRWVDAIMPLVVDDNDPLGTELFATHHVPLTEAPAAYSDFQNKNEGTVKVVFKP